VLADLGQLESAEGRIVLGAAVFDDVIGLVILSVVSGVAGGAAVTVGGASLTAGVAVGFVVAAVVIGGLVVPPLFRSVAARVRTSGALLVVGLALAFGMAYLAESAGSALIIGAFAAGLVLHPTPQRQEIERATTTLGYFFVPVFFASVGAAVDVRTLADPGTLAVGGALIAAAIVGKFAAGYAPVWFRGRKALIGVAMIPRGEVGLIFAQMGLATGALTRDLFSAVALMVMATTFIAPPLLARMATGERGPSDDPYDDGVAGLVGGDPRPTSATAPTPLGRLDDGNIGDLVCGQETDAARPGAARGPTAERGSPAG
jgi:Kef-type K+ transport system membrane component KefB